MQLVPPNVALSFEVTYDSSTLPVAMSVFDTSGGSPVLVAGPDAMTVLPGTNTYYGKFTATPTKNYVIVKAVYTDEDFTDFDPLYSQGSESIVASFVVNEAQSSGCAVIGRIVC